MRVLPTALLLVLSPLAHAQDAPAAPPTPPPAESMGPQPDHTVLRPVGVHKDGVAVVPGPTADCVAKAQVFVPWSLCKRMGSSVDKGPQRFEAYVKGVPPTSPGATCAFVCTPASKLANWSFLLPDRGYRGKVTCPVSRDLTLMLDVQDGDATPSDGATIQWQTDLQETIYTLRDESLMEGHPEDLERMIYESDRLLDGENACPAGQPRRD